MTHRWKFANRVAAVVVATVLVACGDLAGTGRNAEDVASLTGSNGSDTGGGTGTDTGTTNPDTGTGPDTVISDTSTVPDTTYPDTTFPDTGSGPDTTTVPGDTIPDAVINGTMIGIDSTVTPFVELEKLSGVKITAFRWLGVDSSGGTVRPRQDSVAFTVSGRDGTFHFDGLRSGIYVLRAVPPAGLGYLPGEIGTNAYSIRSLVLTAPLKFYLHKKP